MGISCIAEFQRGQAAGFLLKPICSAGKCWGYASVKEKMIEEYKKKYKVWIRGILKKNRDLKQKKQPFKRYNSIQFL